MPHRRKDKGDFLAVMRHISAFLIRFDHQHPVTRRITRRQGAEGRRQLIAQYQDQAPARLADGFAPPYRFRHSMPLHMTAWGGI